MKRTASILLTAVLLLGGCASGEPSTQEANPNAVAENDDNGKKDGAGNEGSEKKERRKPNGEDKRKGGGGPSKKASEGGDGAEGGSGTEDRDEGAATSSGGGAQGNPYPAPGTYRFAQSGYEEFCDSAGRCDKENLPSRQPVTLRYENRSNSSAMVVSEQKASNSRVARTWTRYTSSSAHITKVYVLMEYSGFRFERTYVPQPPVEALRFPLTEGEAWAGRWKASTSGSYAVRVGAPRRIEVGGRSVAAYEVQTTTEFRGDFEGRSRITTYVDSGSKAIVATEGVLNVTSQFGRYTTSFETKLMSGPGY